MRIRFQILIVTLAAVAIAALLIHFPVARAQSVQPFTIHLQEIHYDNDGKVTDFRDTIEAWRSDGSRAEVIRMRSNKPEPTPSGFFERREITDLQKRLRISASVTLNRKTTVPIPSDQPIAPQWNSNCLRFGFREDHQFDKSVRGEPTVYSIRDTILNDGRRWVSREWRAPGLNCALLERESAIEGARNTRSVTVAIDLQKGEPSDLLFSVPGSPVEATPSETLRAVKEYEGDPVSEKCQSTATRADAKYHSRRHAAGLE